MNSGIYQIKNIINGKVYIGSSIDLKRRENEHFNFLRKNKHYNRYLQRAWNKYGEENFKFEVLEYVKDNNDLINKEQFWIDIIDASNQLIGYNLSPTAGSLLGYKKTEEMKLVSRTTQDSKYVIQYDVRGNFIKEWIAINEIARTLNIPYPDVRYNINNKIKFNDSIWVYKESSDNKNILNIIDEFRDKKITGLGKKIVQLDINNNLIKIWASIEEATKTLNIYKGGICKCCKKERKIIHGFKWMYYDEYFNLAI
jgi:group I intron endonuclease